MDEAMDNFKTHFARVLPIIGRDLQSAKVAVLGLDLAEPIIKDLAACGLGKWLWLGAHTEQAQSLALFLQQQHGPALNLDLDIVSQVDHFSPERADRPDLVLAVGDKTTLSVGLRLALKGKMPALLVRPPDQAQPGQAITYFPGDEPPDLAALWPLQGVDFWPWATMAPLCAGLARAMLLRTGPYRRVDLAALWERGIRVMQIASTSDPLRPLWLSNPAWSKPSSAAAADQFQTPSSRWGRLLIAGLGSLGSVAATHLVDWVAGLVVADPDQVDDCNPVRQAYPQSTVGRPKAQALAGLLQAAGLAKVCPLNRALRGEEMVARLVEQHQISAALVVTGTEADFAIARALRQHDIPHVVGRCYPRARYWEAIVVDGRRGPSLSDMRGHLRVGPIPPPTPEQRAAYSDAGALEAEPATLIESGWAAAWLARLTGQILTPPALRERWFLELLAGHQTCLIGGVGVEPTPQGAAYAIDLPGQINSWQRSNIRRDESV